MFTVSHDYYDILGVSKNATPEEIKKQYRKLIWEHHPDQFTGLRAKYQDKVDEDLLKVIDEKIREAEEKCKLINEAFGILSDPVKRKQYDEQVVEPPVSLPEISIHPTRIAFGSLLEGQKKSLVFTIENKGGPPATVNIDWEGDKPDWGELVIEPDVEKVFPIKVTVKVDTTNVPSGPKYEKILVDVDGRIHMVEVFLAVTSPVVVPATGARPPTPPTKTSFTAPPASRSKVPAIPLVILVFVVLCSTILCVSIGTANSANQQSRERGQQVWVTQTAMAIDQQLAPLYQQALSAYESEDWWLAGYYLRQVAQVQVSYRDTDMLLQKIETEHPQGHILVTDGNIYRDGNIYLMDAWGKGLEQIETGSAAALSPSGKKIAFIRGKYLRVGPVHGDHPVVVDFSETKGFIVRSLKWSPNNEFLLIAGEYGRKTRLLIYNIAQDEFTLELAKNIMRVTIHWADWDPSGTRIAYVQAGGWQRVAGSTIRVINADGTGDRIIFQGEYDYMNVENIIRTCSWSPDGKRIAFGYSPHMYLMHPDGSNAEAIVDDGSNIEARVDKDGLLIRVGYGYVWSPDGRRLLRITSSKMWVVDPDGSSVIQIALQTGG